MNHEFKMSDKYPLEDTNNMMQIQKVMISRNDRYEDIIKKN